MKTYLKGASLATIAALIASPAAAQTAAPATAQPNAPRQGGVNEIIVTATKQSENLQDVPIAVNAIDAQALEELNIDTFEDYLEQLPNVTAGGSGPGQSTIYIRGVASTTPNLTTAGVAGLAPNVALYLDEQPLAQPGRNLDVYAADLERVEVLAGPQGTLFGASSQAGVVRLITAKPELSGFQASLDAGVSFTKGGEESYNAEVMLNVPVTDNFALRGVVYLDDQGGYIDNVPGQIDLTESARFRPEGTVRENGVPVNSLRAGFQSTADLSDVTFLNADNGGLVEDDFNDTQYSGFRISGLYEFGPRLAPDGQPFAPDGRKRRRVLRRSRPGYGRNWRSSATRTTGWKTASPTPPGPWKAVSPSSMWSIRVPILTGRRSSASITRTICSSASTCPITSATAASVIRVRATIPAAPARRPTCMFTSDTDTEVFTQELRFSTPQENRIRATVGGFYSDLQLAERNDFNYPGNRLANPFGGFAPNFPSTDEYFSDPGPFPQDTIFRNDILRTDKTYGIFGEISFDIVPDLLTVTGGARYYDIEVDIVGSANGSFCNAGAAQMPMRSAPISLTCMTVTGSSSSTAPVTPTCARTSRWTIPWTISGPPWHPLSPIQIRWKRAHS